MRDSEVRFNSIHLKLTNYVKVEETGGMPKGTIDVWEATGKRNECQYTWDMMRNDNLQTNFGKWRPRCRFDRIYFRDSQPSQLYPANFNLIGLERLRPRVCFPRYY